MATLFVIRLRENKVRKSFAPPGRIHADSRRQLLDEVAAAEADEDVANATTHIEEEEGITHGPEVQS